MTGKRFNCHVKFSAMPNGIMVLDYERHGDEQTVIEDISREKAHRVMDRLNELNNENEQLNNENKSFKAEIEQLKKCYNNALNEMDTLAEVNDKTHKENKELKKQMNRLYNYFWDWHSDEMGGNQFSEMWDGVKESERWDCGW